MKRYLDRWNNTDLNLRYFLIGILFLGINHGILLTTFNNYLNDIFHMTASQRGALEFPREFPGFILIVVTGFLTSYSIRSWAVIVGIVSGIGVFGLGFISPSVQVMAIWMILWSMGDHLFIPVESSMGLHFSREGNHGRRLGQISGAKNLAMIFGALSVYLVSSFISGKTLYMWIYLIGAIFAVGSVWSFRNVHVKEDVKNEKKRFVFRIQYKYFYILNILFGARKQIFLTFAPWLLVTRFETNPGTMAILIFIASIAGVLFRQVFGIFVDRFGEKIMFIADALILIGICSGFSFSKNVYLLYFLFIFDNLMFATRIARTTYLNKIVLTKKDIPSTLSLGVTMDHLVSMTVPFLGGLLWYSFGYQYVFIAAAVIAIMSLILALLISVPEKVYQQK
jgi:predicted MFS family arabinose efflux permease